MIHVDRKWTGSSLKKGSNRIGRWSRVTLEGQGKRRLTIYSVYRVNDSNLDSAGGDTVWMQEYRSLLEVGIKDPNPRAQILHNLKADILALRKDHLHQVMVYIDANESTRRHRTSSINQFLAETGLSD